MLGQRRRRWQNIETTLGECLVFAWHLSIKGPYLLFCEVAKLYALIAFFMISAKVKSTVS